MPVGIVISILVGAGICQCAPIVSYSHRDAGVIKNLRWWWMTAEQSGFIKNLGESGRLPEVN